MVVEDVDLWSEGGVACEMGRRKSEGNDCNLIWELMREVLVREKLRYKKRLMHLLYVVQSFQNLRAPRQIQEDLWREVRLCFVPTLR